MSGSAGGGQLLLRARDVSVRRNGRTILESVTLEIEPGEALAIIGPNGAGKTTLMGTLLGLIKPDAGHVELRGVRIQDRPRRDIARHLAHVPQTHSGYLGFSVQTVVESARYARLRPLDPLGAQDRAAVDEALTLCGLDELRERTVDTLSGGEQQKVWLAAALAQQAEALLLDEPTAALDPRYQAELVGLLRQLRQAGQTIVVICHELNLPAALDARVLALVNGRAVGDGPASEIMNVERLREIHGAEFELTKPQGDAERSYVNLKLWPERPRA